MEPRDVRAAGAVATRKGGEVLLVHRPKYDDWSFPKGKLDPGEHAVTAAVREVAEETGLEVVVGRRSVRTEYEVPEGPKRVDYWLMRVVGGAFEPNHEVDEVRWLPVEQACALVSHAHDRAVLADLACTDVPREPSLLLVRHAGTGPVVVDTTTLTGPTLRGWWVDGVTGETVDAGSVRRRRTIARIVLVS